MAEKKLTRKRVKMQAKTALFRYMEKRRAENVARDKEAKSATMRAVIEPDIDDSGSAPSSGKVVNVIKAGDGFSIPGRLIIEISEEMGHCEIGARWENDVFVKSSERIRGRERVKMLRREHSEMVKNRRRENA